MSTARNIAIIGGGPSGLMAAEILAAKGHTVTVYDAKPTVGRKLLLAGAHGGLNLTHSEPLEAMLPRYGEAASFLDAALKAFSNNNLRDWCHGLGQVTFIGSSGRVFPKEMQSKSLLRAWLVRLRDLGVQFALQHRWTGWDGEGRLRFHNAKDEEIAVKADACLLALGGASWPRTGSNGSWYEILQEQGIALSPLCPANCGFTVPWTPYIAHRFAGEVLKPVTLSFEGQTQQGEISITEQGIEGSVVYAFSPAIRKAIARDGKATITLDLRFGLSYDELVEKLQMPRKALSFSNYLRKAAGITPLCNALLREVVPPEKLPIHDVEALAKLIKELPLTLTKAGTLDRAISTSGGVKFEALNDYFMLKDKSGVFVAGEMMDWEAPTGGYLLQGCFSTGAWAARGILKLLEQ